MNLNDLDVRPFDKKTREQYLDLCQFCFNMPAPSRDAKMVGGLVRDLARSSVGKLFSRRLVQDLGGRLGGKK